MNINKCICTGRLTKDPELRKISEEMSVCQLRVAVDGMGRGREVGYVNVACSARPERPAPSTSARAGWSRSMAAWSTASGRPTGGEKRHDYSVVGNVEFLTAPKPVEEQESAKPARNGRKAVAA